MATITDMKFQRDQAAQRMRALSDETPPGEWSEAVQAEFDKAHTEYENIDRALVAARNVESVEADVRKNEETRTAEIRRMADFSNVSVDEAGAAADDKRRVYMTWVRGGPNALTSLEDHQMLRAMQITPAQMAMPKNTLVAGTDSAGGYMVPTWTRGMILENMVQWGGMRPVATVQDSMSGAEIQWPTVDETTQEGEIVAENTAATNQDPTFGQRTLKFDMWSSKQIIISRQLIQDSSVEQLEAVLVRYLANRMARIQAKLMTNGSTNTAHNVQGILDEPTATGGGAKKGITLTTSQANRTAITFDNLLSLIHSLDPAFRDGSLDGTGMGMGMARFMFNDGVLRTLKGIKDGDQRPLWLPSVGNDSPSTIYGYPYTVNQQMPAPAQSAKTIIFGDLTNYLILDAMNMMTYRFDTESEYALKQVVGFVCFMRTAASLVDQGGNSVRYHQQSTG